MRCQPFGQRSRLGAVARREDGGDIDEGRCGAGVGVDVVGDAGLLVGGEDRGVQHRALAGCQLRTQQHRHDGVREQSPPTRRVRCWFPATGQVEGVDAHPRGAQLYDRAAGRFGQPDVLLFRVHDQHLHAVVERAQDVEFRQVGLASAGARKHDRVVVVHHPTVEADQAGAGAVHPQQHRRGGALNLGELVGGERKARRQGLGVEGAPDPQAVDTDRQRRRPALHRPERGRNQPQQHPVGDRLHRGHGLGQFVFAVGEDGEVDADVEQPSLSTGDAVGQFAGVGRCRFGDRVVQAPALGGGTPSGLDAGPLLAQPVGGDRRGDWFDVDGDVDPSRVGQNRLQPARPDFRRVGGHSERGGMGRLPDSQGLRPDREAGRTQPERVTAPVCLRSAASKRKDRAGGSRQSGQGSHEAVLLYFWSGSSAAFKTR